MYAFGVLKCLRLHSKQVCCQSSSIFCWKFSLCSCCSLSIQLSLPMITVFLLMVMSHSAVLVFQVIQSDIKTVYSWDFKWYLLLHTRKTCLSIWILPYSKTQSLQPPGSSGTAEPWAKSWHLYMLTVLTILTLSYFKQCTKVGITNRQLTVTDMKADWCGVDSLVV